MWRIGILISLALTSLPGLASDNFPLFEKDRTGWALYVDNDLIADGSKDQDCTGGIAVTLSGARAAEYSLSVDGWLTALNSFSKF